MDEAAARLELESLVQADADPVLAVDEVTQLLAAARRVDPAGNPPTNVASAAVHATSAGYQAGDVVRAAGRWWRCLIAGTSGAPAPAWPDLTHLAVTETKIVDGDVTWIDNGGEWSPTWDLRGAARSGWLRKAGKAAARYDFTTDGQTFRRGMTYAQCADMADRYRGRGLTSVQSS
jgi:hypothetical protein